MTRNKRSQAEFSKGAKTPEEAFDRQLLSGNYMMFLIVVLFLAVGVEGFVALMPLEVAVAVAGIFSCLAAGFLGAPLFWEVDYNNRMVRRVRRASYFPISIRAFIISKWKLMSICGAIFCAISLAMQLLMALLIRLSNILIYQAVLIGGFAANMLLYTIIGTVGAKVGE